VRVNIDHNWSKGRNTKLVESVGQYAPRRQGRDELTEAPTVGIGRLLKEDGRFFIPHHQRDYSWTVDELEQLFGDIKDAQDSNQSEYFIGLMVFMPEGERKFTILDGQQRLATTIVIMAAIRSWLTARGYRDDANQIQEHYVALREYGRQDWEPSLVLNESNNDTFERHVVRE
jgi:hypothetical protein